MTARRAFAAFGAAVSIVPLTAGPSSAHGALSSPASRAALCGPEGGDAARTAACRAAVAAGAPGALERWDNLRVPGIGGRDRAMIPDGRLCSAGLDQFRGLDLARTDWPATRLTGGAAFTFRYRTTIPHPGTFKLYVTGDGFDPSRRLTWSALQSRPFLQVTDPARQNGAYVLRGRLPTGRTGRHVIYTIWQTTDSTDTYYSCSDVLFRGPATEKSTNGPRRTASAAPPQDGEPPVAPTLAPAAATDDDRGGLDPLPWALGGAAVLLILTAAFTARLLRRSDARHSRRNG